MMVDVVERGGVVAVLHEDARESIAELPLREASEILIVVGPEGGLEPGEVDDFRALGARPVLLGPEVVRTSTAAAVALGAIGALTPRWTSR